MTTQWEREEDQLERDLADGLIDMKEFNAQMRELRRDYRDAAEESARDAYDREMSNW